VSAARSARRTPPSERGQVRDGRPTRPFSSRIVPVSAVAIPSLDQQPLPQRPRCRPQARRARRPQIGHRVSSGAGQGLRWETRPGRKNRSVIDGLTPPAADSGVAPGNSRGDATPWQRHSRPQTGSLPGASCGKTGPARLHKLRLSVRRQGTVPGTRIGIGSRAPTRVIEAQAPPER
jgi:hypothetical protein